MFPRMLMKLVSLRTLSSVHSEQVFALRLQDKKLPPLLSEIWDVHEWLHAPRALTCRHNAISQPLLTRSQSPLSKALNSGLGSAGSDEPGVSMLSWDYAGGSWGRSEWGGGLGVGFNVVPIPQTNNMKHLKTVEMKTFPTHTYTSFFRVFLFSKHVLRACPLILSPLVDYEMNLQELAKPSLLRVTQLKRLLQGPQCTWIWGAQGSQCGCSRGFTGFPINKISCMCCPLQWFQEK